MLSETDAYLLFERLRWGDRQVTCPHCHQVGRCYFLRPVGRDGRTTRTGAPTARRVWKCGACRRQFSVLTGTIFEGTRVPLAAWADAVDELTSGRPVTGAELARRHGLTTQSGRQILRRLAAAGVDRTSPPTESISYVGPRAGRD